MPKPLSKRQGKRAYNLRPTEITLKGHAFRVNDISTEGIGLIVEEN
ncbi:MAG: hypothetical protein JJV98_17970, partial [Desulfosarcina sp.]|nr:hypothetical protein [Desulfobacterales bacterium]